MEVVAEAGGQQPWDQFKEEVEIMEEEHGGGADSVEELLTREIRKRLGHSHGHGSSNGNGNGAHHANGGEEEEEEEDDNANGGEQEEEKEVEEVKVAAEEEEQRQHNKRIFLDPAKVAIYHCLQWFLS